MENPELRVTHNLKEIALLEVAQHPPVQIASHRAGNMRRLGRAVLWISGYLLFQTSVLLVRYHSTSCLNVYSSELGFLRRGCTSHALAERRPES